MHALAEYKSPEFGLWPENAAPIDVLVAMRTQVRTAGINGRVIGFDYAVLPWVMAQVGVPQESIAEVFGKFQSAEDAFLSRGG